MVSVLSNYLLVPLLSTHVNTYSPSLEPVQGDFRNVFLIPFCLNKQKHDKDKEIKSSEKEKLGSGLQKES